MSESVVAHRKQRMTGRDPDEHHRVATPLELLFDLTFVVAFGTAANALAHAFAEDHVGAGLAGFAFATFGISWAWINFTWFASAYDTDDWVYRLTTMLQMVGVLIFALGLAPMFESIHDGDHLDNDVMVWGYVVMRVAMVFQWWRASRQDPARLSAHRAYIGSIIVAQVLWCATALIDLPVTTTFAVMVIPFLVEIGGPAYAEKRCGGTPWHAHHVAERYGLMVIITLGEGMIGTMVSLTALSEDGLTLDVALLAFAGTALAFGIWWMYFGVPHGEILEARREASFVWGYGHMVLFGGIVAIGAGLHVAAYYLEHHTKLGVTASVLTVVVPVAVVIVAYYLLYSVTTRSADAFHLLLMALTVIPLVAAVLMAAGHVDITWCLVVLSLAPWVTVAGYESVGHRHLAATVARLKG
ncbi:low temperature requirement protein A [Nocardioides sp. WS12]|uniref:low temperature requirement protein A n=1 Tax=Nocardioides sp. WS12 TaxID=2486272 RepID=UPI001F3FA605|nr:low temperature requirement protein A [Nocardioides sp. WS12]